MKTVSDVDAELARLQQLRLDLLRHETERERAQQIGEAQELTDQLRTTVARLHEIGYLAPKLVEVLTDKKGKFNPGMFIKSPRKGNA